MMLLKDRTLLLFRNVIVYTMWKSLKRLSYDYTSIIAVTACPFT